MRLAISNIAWQDGEDNAVAEVLSECGVQAIEVAPGRLSNDPLGLSGDAVDEIAAGWTSRGLPIRSMQALLFGRPELRLFGPDDGQSLIDYVSDVFRLAGRLGAGPAVFGSPKNREKGDLSLIEATDKSVPVFRALGDAAVAHGVTLCLEPNATGYGCDFMTTLDETATVVRETDHPGVGLIVDTGNMQMASDTAANAARHADIARHVHISRPQLAPVDGTDDFGRQVLRAMRDAGYESQVTIEMRRQEADPIGAIRIACSTVRRWIDEL